MVHKEADTHTEQGVILIADQEIRIKGKLVNIHHIKSIEVDDQGLIVNAFIELKGEDQYDYLRKAAGWLF